MRAGEAKNGNGWTVERRAAAAERMAGRQIGSGRGRVSDIPVEDRKLILALWDERDTLRERLVKEKIAYELQREELREALAAHKAEWERRQAAVLAQLAELTVAKVAAKFELKEGQVRQIIDGAASNSL